MRSRLKAAYARPDSRRARKIGLMREVLSSEILRSKSFVISPVSVIAPSLEEKSTTGGASAAVPRLPAGAAQRRVGGAPAATSRHPISRHKGSGSARWADTVRTDRRLASDAWRCSTEGMPEQAIPDGELVPADAGQRPGCPRIKRFGQCLRWLAVVAGNHAMDVTTASWQRQQKCDLPGRYESAAPDAAIFQYLTPVHSIPGVARSPQVLARSFGRQAVNVRGKKRVTRQAAARRRKGLGAWRRSRMARTPA